MALFSYCLLFFWPKILATSAFCDVQFHDQAKQIHNILIFVKIALSITDERAKILLINNFWYLPSKPTIKASFNCYNVAEKKKKKCTVK